MNTPSDVEQRTTELEVRLSFLDDTVTTLNAAVALHDRDLIALREIVERLRNELSSVRVSLSHDAHDEPPPPHY